MPDFILQNHVQGGQMDVTSAGAFVRTEDSGEPIQITVLSGSIYLAVGEMPELNGAVSALINEGETVAFGGDAGSTPESIGIRATVGTATVRIFQGPFVSRGPEAAGGGGGSGSPSLPAEFITNDANIYVSYTGSDTTGDGSEVNPFYSVNKALQPLHGKTISGAQILIYIEPEASETSYSAMSYMYTPFWSHIDGAYSMAACNISLRDINVINGGSLEIGRGLTGPGPSWGKGPGVGLLGVIRCRATNGLITIRGFHGAWGYIHESDNIELNQMAFGYDAATPMPFPIFRVGRSHDIYFRDCWLYGGDPGIEAREQSSVRCRYTYVHSNNKGVAPINGSSIYLSQNCRSGYQSPYSIASIAKVGADQMVITLSSSLFRWDQEINHVYVSGAAQSQNNGFFPVPNSPHSLSEPGIIRAINNNCVDQPTPAGTAEPSQKGPAIYLRDAGTVGLHTMNMWTFRGVSNYSQGSGLLEIFP